MDSQPFRLDLPLDLVIRHIHALHGQLLAALEKSAVVLDIPADAKADLSFVQLIESARLQARSSGHTLSLAAPACGAILDVLNRAGLVETFSTDDSRFWLHQEIVQ